MLDAHHIIRLQDEATTRWHDPASVEPTPATSQDALILNLHRANFDLWHHEDAARDLLASDHEITAHKHAIDILNQRRNDIAEQIDLLLLSKVPTQNATAPLHSETPGMIIDRLSILALKHFHTVEETRRLDAPSAHHERNYARLAILNTQRNDLAGCLDALWQDVLSSRRRFKLYRQMKMYNDPTLNPVLYRKDLIETPGPGDS
jgi:hypothetical protein